MQVTQLTMCLHQGQERSGFWHVSRRAVTAHTYERRRPYLSAFRSHQRSQVVTNASARGTPRRRQLQTPTTRNLYIPFAYGIPDGTFNVVVDPKDVGQTSDTSEHYPVSSSSDIKSRPARRILQGLEHTKGA